MIRKGLLLMLFLCLMGIVNAAEPMFIKGDKYVNLGIGLNPYPVVNGIFDYCLVDGIVKGSIGVGGYAGMGFESGKYKHIFTGARGTIHYPIVEDLDTYVGASLGFCFDVDPFGSYGPYFIKGIFLGANYPLSNNIIVFGELGTGIAYLNAGITLLF